MLLFQRDVVEKSICQASKFGSKYNVFFHNVSVWVIIIVINQDIYFKTVKDGSNVII